MEGGSLNERKGLEATAGKCKGDCSELEAGDAEAKKAG